MAQPAIDHRYLRPIVGANDIPGLEFACTVGANDLPIGPARQNFAAQARPLDDAAADRHHTLTAARRLPHIDGWRDFDSRLEYELKLRRLDQFLLPNMMATKSRRKGRGMKFIDVKRARVPALGFGTWPLSGTDCSRAVAEAIALGYRHIDTAQLYGNEAEVGAGISQSGVARDELWITTKLSRDHLTAAAVAHSTEESLRKLSLDHLDLLLIHWPSRTVPLAETLEAMTKLRQSGKTRFIGVSNFTTKLLDEAVTHADIICDQVEYHPFLAQRAVLGAVKKHGLFLTAYSPVARGRVPGDRTLQAIGRKYGKSAAQVALRWLLDQDNVAAIPKAGSRAHMQANLAIFDFALSPEDRTAIDALGGDRRIVDIAGWSPDWDRPN
jgi:2,5-diketo-D-gluconate reductase B